MKRALISVTDKTGVAEFGRSLLELGYSLLSTGGTYAALREAGLAVEQVAEYTEFPEILGGRVKTLHPRIHGGILGQRDDAAACATMAQHGIDPIDVVVVNLYRFRETASRPGITESEVVEQIDIGGPSMIRSAAKNHAHVTVVVDPADYGRVAAALRTDDPQALVALRRELAAAAFAHTARYDAAIAEWFAERTGDAATLPANLVVTAEKLQDLRYGENPHQRAAFYAVPSAPAPNLATAKQLAGKELSYNNLLDLDAALNLATEFAQPACVIVKHTNPCGAAMAPDAARAFAAALASDPVSAFGGIVALNRDIDLALAQAIAGSDVFLEAIVAPRIAADAVPVLQAVRGGKNLRMLSLEAPPGALAPIVLRPVRGGLLAQSTDVPQPELDLQVRSSRAPTAAERDALAFAWRVCKHTKSNAIVLAAAVAEGVCATVGVGAGQMSRVESVEIACAKAAARARGAVLASDAFFPFADGLQAAAAHGVTAVIQPGGSRRDDEVIAAADEASMAMVFTGVRHFRH